MRPTTPRCRIAARAPPVSKKIATNVGMWGAMWGAGGAREGFPRGVGYLRTRGGLRLEPPISTWVRGYLQLQDTRALPPHVRQSGGEGERDVAAGGATQDDEATSQA